MKYENIEAAKKDCRSAGNRKTKSKNLQVCPADERPPVSEKERQLANKWITELTEAGYTPHDMVCIFREARRKYDDYKKRMSQLKSKNK